MTPTEGMNTRRMPNHKHTINILNPTTGGASYTNLRKANKFVLSGRAIWVGGAIEFLRDPRRLFLALLTERKLRTMDQAGYDGVGLMTIDQAQGLPCAGPAARLFTKGGRLVPKRENCHTISKISF